MPSLICIRYFRIRKNVITRKESYELIERHQISASGKSKQVPIGRQPQTSANQQKALQQQETQQIVGPQTRSKQKGNPKYLKESQVNDIQHQLHHGAHNYYGNPHQQGYQGQSNKDSGSYGSGSYNEIVEIEHHPPQQKPQKIQEPPPKQTGQQSAKNQWNQPQSNSRTLEGSSSDSLHSNNVIRKTITKTYYYGPSNGPKNHQRGNRGYGSGSPSESMKSNNDIITTKTYHYNSSGNQQRSNQQSRNQQQSKQGKQGKQSKSKINTIYDSPTESIASNNGEIVATKTYHYRSSGNQQRSNQQSRHQQQRNEFQSSSRDSPFESMRSNHGKSVANQQRSHQVRSQASSFTAQAPLTGIRADGPRQQRAGSFPHSRHGNQQLQSSKHSHSSTQTAQQEALESKKSRK